MLNGTGKAFVYIMASKRNGTLYLGVTTDLVGRVYEHRNSLVDGFTAKYGVRDLVYYETFDDISKAIVREKQLKSWRRLWKIRLIETENPQWQDLYPDIVG